MVLSGITTKEGITMNYKVKTTENKSQLDKLYNCSALTIEGLTESSINDFAEHLDKLGCTVKEMWITSGKMMNESYSLIDGNTYPDDLTIVSATGDMVPAMVERFYFGGRWFDDIVDNLLAHQQDFEYEEV